MTISELHKRMLDATKEMEGAQIGLDKAIYEYSSAESSYNDAVEEYAKACTKSAEDIRSDK